MTLGIQFLFGHLAIRTAFLITFLILGHSLDLDLDHSHHGHRSDETEGIGNVGAENREVMVPGLGEIGVDQEQGPDQSDDDEESLDHVACTFRLADVIPLRG